MNTMINTKKANQAGLKYQLGMTMNEIFVILILIGFIATAAVKLLPLYADNSTVKSAFESVKDDLSGKDISEMSNKQIIGKVNKYFQINQISNDIVEAVEIERKGKHVYLRANYEIRNEFMGNIDVVVKFENEIDLAAE